METLKNKEDVVSNEVALKEVGKFVETFTFESIEDWKLEDSYPQLLKAVKKGLVVFDEKGNPVVELLQPINDTDGEHVVSSVTFRTRIKPTDLSNITKGLDVTKQQVEYTLRCLSYITKLNKSYLDKLCKFDYKVIEQTSTVFF